MIRVDCLFVLALLTAISPAVAGGDIMISHPEAVMSTDAAGRPTPIPCAGRLTEVRSESGNMSSADNGLVLICQTAPNHAQWIIHAAAGCDVDTSTNDNANLEMACGLDIAKPIGEFYRSVNGANRFLLGRYVFAFDCENYHFHARLREVLTNKEKSSYIDNGWVCRNVSKFDSLTGYDPNTGAPSGSKNFRYATVTTIGGEERSAGEGDIDNGNILGISTSDWSYAVHSDGHGPGKPN